LNAEPVANMILCKLAGDKSSLKTKILQTATSNSRVAANMRFGRPQVRIQKLMPWSTTPGNTMTGDCGNFLAGPEFELA